MIYLFLKKCVTKITRGELSMSIRITVDSNFFNAFHNCTDKPFKKQFLKLIENRQVSFYPNIQLFEELIGLYTTNRKQMLKEFSRLFLCFMNNRFLNDWKIIIQIELGVLSSEGYFLKTKEVKNIKEMLSSLSKGNNPHDIASILQWIEGQKRQQFSFYETAKAKTLDFLEKEARKEEIKKIRKMDMATINSMKKIRQWKKKIISNICSRGNRLISEKTLEDVVNNPQRYPYINAYLNLSISLSYSHVFLRERVDRGDSYDLYQLTYLAGLDYFITNDKKLKRVHEFAYGKKDQVLSLKGLIRKLKNT